MSTATVKVKLLANWGEHASGEVIDIEAYHLHFPDAYGLVCEVLAPAPAETATPAEASAPRTKRAAASATEEENQVPINTPDKEE